LALQLDFLFEPLLFGGDFGFHLEPMLLRLTVGSAGVLLDLISPLAHPLFVPPGCHLVLLRDPARVVQAHRSIGVEWFILFYIAPKTMQTGVMFSASVLQLRSRM